MKIYIFFHLKLLKINMFKNEAFQKFELKLLCLGRSGMRMLSHTLIKLLEYKSEQNLAVTYGILQKIGIS